MSSEHGTPTDSGHDADPSAETAAAENPPTVGGATANDSMTTADPAPTGGSSGGATAHHRRPMKINHTRTAGTWAAVVVAIVVLVVLLIFILQNGQPVTVTFLGARASLPLGVAMLLSAAIGGLLVALIGTARILQLRRSARRRH